MEPISNRSAAAILDAKHQLGAGHAPSLAFGIYWNGRCEGVITFGAPIANNAVHRYRLRQDEVLELRKMWVSDVPPAMSESRALAVVAKLIRKRYSHLKLLLTYCEGDERAAAYKASGWIPQTANRYLREYRLPSGAVMSVRDVNRKGGERILPTGTEKIFVHRRKWVLPLTPEVASVVQSSTPAVQAGDGGSRPTRTLHSTLSGESTPAAATTTPTPHCSDMTQTEVGGSS